MYLCLIKNKVCPEHIQQYIEAARAFAQDTKTVKGCIDAYIMQDAQNEDIIVNVELWKSKEDKDQDDGSVFLKHKPNLRPFFLGNEFEAYYVK